MTFWSNVAMESTIYIYGGFSHYCKSHLKPLIYRGYLRILNRHICLPNGTLAFEQRRLDRWKRINSCWVSDKLNDIPVPTPISNTDMDLSENVRPQKVYGL
jgi:hypothetical protein